MNLKIERTILLVGTDETLSYLLGRFVEQAGGELIVSPGIPSAQEIAGVNPNAIIFLSMQQLEAAQALMTEMEGIETPIIVCTAVTDQARAGELGADHCLIHPITYGSFQLALEVPSASNYI